MKLSDEEREQFFNNFSKICKLFFIFMGKTEL